MKNLIFSIALAAVWCTATAQTTYSRVLAEVEANSTKLKALRKQADVQKLSNRTGIFLKNPEVELGYGWGRPSDVGTKKELSVTQPFDFPTAYFYRSKLAEMENSAVDLAYRAGRMEIMLAVKQACIELVYLDAMSASYAKRLEIARCITAIYDARLKKGDANILETNNAHILVSLIGDRLREYRQQRRDVYSELERLNGGRQVEFESAVFVLSELPDSFEEWYAAAEAHNPLLASLRGEADIAHRRVKLDRAMTLPKLSVGYAGEKTLGEEFRGIIAGFSIPLWENRNTVRSAKARAAATEAQVEDVRVELYCRMRNLYFRASDLRAAVDDLRTTISKFDNSRLLDKAHDMGEITLLDYLAETDLYYEAIERLLTAERDYELAVAELSAFEL